MTRWHSAMHCRALAKCRCLARMGAAEHACSNLHTWTPSSRCIFFKLGKVVDSSCRTMDALMYGTMPAQPGCASEHCASAQPLHATGRGGLQLALCLMTTRT